MSPQRLCRATQAEFRRRLEMLRPDTGRRWGSMTATQLMAHLRRSFELSLGHVPVPDESNWLSRTVLKWLVFATPMPWPKGRIKAPASFFPDDPRDFASERAATLRLLEEFVARSEARPAERVVSQFLGPTSLGFYQRVHGRHLDHHLRQFGL